MTTKTDYIKYFKVSKRATTGYEFIKLTDDAPENLKDLVRNIHLNFGVLPNDWIYLIIMEAFEELEDNDIDKITIEADCYYHDLYKWFGEPFAHALVNEYLSEIGSDCRNIYEIIGHGQSYCKDLIYNEVNNFITNEMEE